MPDKVGDFAGRWEITFNRDDDLALVVEIVITDDEDVRAAGWNFYIAKLTVLEDVHTIVLDVIRQLRVQKLALDALRNATEKRIDLDEGVNDLPF